MRFDGWREMGSFLHLIEFSSVWVITTLLYMSSIKLCVTHNRVSGEIFNFVATWKFFVLRFEAALCVA